MTLKGRTRVCAHCKQTFTESRRDSNSQWERREFCSKQCNNRSIKRATDIFDRLEKYQIKKDGCWSWSGTKDPAGYGVLSGRRINGRRTSPEKAHRVSYEKHFGPIPEGLVVRHNCDNPECTNPDHLLVGTQKDNSRDMVDRGRHNKNSLENLNHNKILNEIQIEELKSIVFASRNGRGGTTKKSVAERFGVHVDTIKNELRRIANG